MLTADYVVVLFVVLITYVWMGPTFCNLADILGYILGYI